MANLINFFADESESVKRLTVAAYLFTENNAIALGEKWNSALRKDNPWIEYFHMVDCANGGGVFKHLHTRERDKIQRDLFPILLEHVEVGFSVSIELEHADLLPSSVSLGIKKLRPYTFCCYWLMYNARRWVSEKYPVSKIAYFYEAGGPGEKEFARVITTLYENDWQRDHFRIASYCFVNKTEIPAIQCADILAWQWGKAIKNLLKDRPQRKDLMVLLEGKPHFTTHFNKPRLLEMREILRANPTDFQKAFSAEE